MIKIDFELNSGCWSEEKSGDTWETSRIDSESSLQVVKVVLVGLQAISFHPQLSTSSVGVVVEGW